MNSDYLKQIKNEYKSIKQEINDRKKIIISQKSEINDLEHKINKWHHFLWRSKNPNAINDLTELKEKLIDLKSEIKPYIEKTKELELKILTEEIKYVQQNNFFGQIYPCPTRNPPR